MMRYALLEADPTITVTSGNELNPAAADVQILTSAAFADRPSELRTRFFLTFFALWILGGSLMAIWRVLRCNPFNPGGFDPVP